MYNMWHLQAYAIAMGQERYERRERIVASNLYLATCFKLNKGCIWTVAQSTLRGGPYFSYKPDAPKVWVPMMITTWKHSKTSNRTKPKDYMTAQSKFVNYIENGLYSTADCFTET